MGISDIRVGNLLRTPRKPEKITSILADSYKFGYSIKYFKSEVSKILIDKIGLNKLGFCSNNNCDIFWFPPSNLDNPTLLIINNHYYLQTNGGKQTSDNNIEVKYIHELQNYYIDNHGIDIAINYL